MADHRLAEYGVAYEMQIDLVKLNGVDLEPGAVHAVGDTKLRKDNGAEANTTNGFTDRGQSYSLTLTAAEMQAKEIIIALVDQTAPKAWMDKLVVIQTVNDANALLPRLWASVREWLAQAVAVTVNGVPRVDVTHIGGTAVTAAAGIPEVKVASIANNAITAASIAADAITDAKVAADVTIASVTGAVGSVTGNVGGNVVGSVGSVVARVTANADQIEGLDATNQIRDSVLSDATRFAGADVALIKGFIDTEVAAILTAVDTEIAAIKLKTDNLPTDPADASDILASFTVLSALVDDLEGRLGVPAGASLSADVAAVKAETSSIQADTNDLQTRTPPALVGGRMDSNVGAIAGDTDAPGELARSASTIVLVTVGVGSAVGSVVTSSLVPAAAVIDQFKGRILIFDKDTATANLRGQATDITANTAGGVLTVTALTTAPANGDTGVIV